MPSPGRVTGLALGGERRCAVVHARQLRGLVLRLQRLLALLGCAVRAVQLLQLQRRRRAVGAVHELLRRLTRLRNRALDVLPVVLRRGGRITLVLLQVRLLGTGTSLRERVRGDVAHGLLIHTRERRLLRRQGALLRGRLLRLLRHTLTLLQQAEVVVRDRRERIHIDARRRRGQGLEHPVRPHLTDRARIRVADVGARLPLIGLGVGELPRQAGCAGAHAKLLRQGVERLGASCGLRRSTGAPRLPVAARRLAELGRVVARLRQRGLLLLELERHQELLHLLRQRLLLEAGLDAAVCPAKTPSGLSVPITIAG